MDIDYTKLLPKELPEGFVGWICSNGGFAKEYLIYRNGRRYLPLEERWEDCVEVTCTECGQTFQAEKVHAGGCHNSYAPAPFGWFNREMGEHVISGTDTLCPICGKECETVHIGSMRPYIEDSEYTTTVSRIELEGKQDRLLLIDWRTDRIIDKRGGVKFRNDIWSAWVVEEKKIVRILGYQKYFATVCRTAPTQKKTFLDNYEKYIRLYPMEDGALDGTTAENCKLDRYVSDGGVRLVAYLALWRKRPQVENLVMQGCAKLIDDLIDREQHGGGNGGIPKLKDINWKEKCPHQMMRMSKEEWRGWGRRMSVTELTVWSWARENGLHPDENEMALLMDLGLYPASALLKEVEAKKFFWAVRYLRKNKSGYITLRDYWCMAGGLDMNLSEERVRWPKDLLAAHDNVAEQIAARKKIARAAGFATMRKRLAGLEWTDGRLCIVVPQNEQELIDEGRILRHCVGSYGKSHCDGKPIFFVRHYRRPERSYYTLNIDLTGAKPVRVQLHGYGNERHGKNKEYTHTIPKEVLEFCDRWEREVLAPWWSKQKSKTKNKKKKKEEQAA